MKMKRFTASLLAVCMLVMAFSTTLAGTAFALDEGNGAEIIISNSASTGLSLEDHSFDVYEVFTATISETDTDVDGNQLISYLVSEDFVVFFLYMFQAEDTENLYEDSYGDYDTEETYDYSDYEEAYYAAFEKTYENQEESDAAIAAFQNIIGTVMTDSTFHKAAYNYVESYAANMADLVDDLRAFVLTEEYGIDPLSITWSAIETDTTNGTETIKTETSRSLLGYYLVLDSADTLATRDQNNEEVVVDTSSVITAGALVTVPSRDTDGTLSRSSTIYIKGSAPTLTKEVWHNDLKNDGEDYSLLYGDTGSWDIVSDYQIGDTIEFRLTASIPTSVEGYEDYIYIITDTPEDGITIDTTSIKVYTDAALSSATTGGMHTITKYDDGSFSISFDMLDIYAQAQGTATKFYIYYTATIDETAIVSMEYETNTATLEYSTNPYDYQETNTVSSDVYVYTFDLDVFKTSDDEVSALPGATFALYEIQVDGSSSKTQLYLAQLTDDDGQNIYAADENGDEIIPIYYIATGKTPSDVVGNTVGTITTDETGRFNIIGLDDATTYQLTEINAPDGYNAADPISFTISASYTYDTSTGTPILKLDTTSSSDIEATGNVLSTTVVNTSSAMLPSTGGMGTTLLTYGGIILMVGAGTALLIKRKKSR